MLVKKFQLFVISNIIAADLHLRFRGILFFTRLEPSETMATNFLGPLGTSLKATRRNVSEDGYHQLHSSENFKPHIFLLFSGIRECSKVSCSFRQTRYLDNKSL